MTMEFVSLEEVELLARQVLPKMAYDYYSSGAESQASVDKNREAFKQHSILPRMLVDVSTVDMARTLPGFDFTFPVAVAPMAMHGLAHPDREIATARAAAAAGIPFVFSTMATSSFEEVAATGHPCLIYQLYVIKNREVVRGWVQEAEARGFKALMVTVDAQRLGRREADIRNRFHLPEGLHLKVLEPLRRAQQAQHAEAAAAVTEARDISEGSGLTTLFAKEVDDSLTWDFIPWLRSITRLPIYLKGVLAPEDAAIAVQHGVDGIVVSNHGGRQLDHAPSALEMLPAVVAAVGGRVPVLMDGGVRRGTDVLKALALGASAVLLGRPVLYGLALGGQAGVSRVLQLLREELELAMALSGCPSLSHISSRLLLPAGPTAGPPARPQCSATAPSCAARCAVGAQYAACSVRPEAPTCAGPCGCVGTLRSVVAARPAAQGCCGADAAPGCCASPVCGVALGCAAAPSRQSGYGGVAPGASGCAPACAGEAVACCSILVTGSSASRPSSAASVRGCGQPSGSCCARGACRADDAQQLGAGCCQVPAGRVGAGSLTCAPATGSGAACAGPSCGASAGAAAGCAATDRACCRAGGTGGRCRTGAGQTAQAGGGAAGAVAQQLYRAKL